jgi:hypothetical protein
LEEQAAAAPAEAGLARVLSEPLSRELPPPLPVMLAEL